MFNVPVLTSGNEPDNFSGKYKDYNVVLLTFDAMRPDHLGIYGYHQNTSPAMDALAKQGIIFDHAYSQSSLTIMSVTSIYTSVYPFSHGIRHVLKDGLDTRKLMTFAETMKNNGYATAWFGSSGDIHTGSVPGLLKEFDDIIDLNEKSMVSPRPDPKPITAWIDSHWQKKMFITIHSYLTHDHHFPYRNYHNTFSDQIPDEFRQKTDITSALMKDCTKENYDAFLRILEDWPGKNWLENARKNIMEGFEKLKNDKKRRFYFGRHIMKAFTASLKKEDMPYIGTMLDSSIYEADQKIVKALIDKLSEKKVLDRTIIIITADHGNEFLEHGHFGHGQYVYDESIHIPLIFYIPHLSKAIRFDGLTESIDIFPTTLDLLDIPLPPQVQGVSQVGNFTSSALISFKKYVVSESISGQMCIRFKKWKLIGTLNREDFSFKMLELYDMENDPGELTNVIEEHAEEAQELRSILMAKLENTKRYHHFEKPFSLMLDKETRENIIKTGYW